MPQVAFQLDEDTTEALSKAADRDDVTPADWARNAVVHQLQREEPLADCQYRLASRYPGEYVVLVGERVIRHTTDRAEAGRAFKQVFADDPKASPVMVDPNVPNEPRPVVRGRALAGRLKV